MQKVMIIGATSAMAEATARLYAARGAALLLAGRDPQRLRAIADDLRVRGAAKAETFQIDLLDLDAHAALVDAAWKTLGTVDIVLIAHGTLPDQTACEASPELALREFSLNANSTISLCTHLAPRLREQHGGTLAVISSVAGDRGRASNYVYGSAKAAVSAFLGGLRQRLHGTGVNVLTIKPGFVDTPMTRAFNKGPLWATPAQVARGIVRAIDRGASVVYLPRFWWPIMLTIRCIPEFVFRRIQL